MFFRHRLELELLRERQRRELQLARLRLRHNHPSNANTLTPTGGGYMARSIDSSGSSPHGPLHIPFPPTGAHITSRVMLPSSISLPGSPPQNSFLGQHVMPLRDALVCLFHKNSSTIFYNWDHKTALTVGTFIFV